MEKLGSCSFLPKKKSNPEKRFNGSSLENAGKIGRSIIPNPEGLKLKAKT